MRLIGDLHGNLAAYKQAIKSVPQSIQLGDFGVGFVPIQELLDLDEQAPFHKFFTGNHDDDKHAKLYKRNLLSGPLNESTFILRGAWSIDRWCRSPGFDWWPEEQHTQEELDNLTKLYLEQKPETVLSHDCPTLAAYYLFFRDPRFVGYEKDTVCLNRTGEALQKMFEQHQPKRWFFGHWHFSKKLAVNGTLFQCLNINEVVDIEW